ncbi:MupG family TIM beta-alpha barrel fold protein [Sneathia sanguinegens]|uniref:MupG family TIM beta-alpha barrel fold protein n=1 Tax=Sneathia sanguinegens TaxID=40543 RepID=A0ABT7HIY3_9FUSO|nr:MupG family TIM beta-alpha barrel fold protein [Sneathia sanguinegens]MDK9580486.1 MupG family TIM beta-alpha barrel fold protein [Sneathia sanguinegens]
MVNNIEFGISIYLSTNIEMNSEYLLKAKEVNSSFVFTTINMPEENDELKKDISKVVELCKKNKMKLIVDINANSKKYIKDYENVYYRIDDGLSNDEIIALAKNNYVVLNSTTLDEEDLKYFKLKGVDFSKLYSLHNYYPKVYTGVSLKFLKKRNEIYKKYGLKTMAFIPGNLKRGPIFEGLPTVEEHRYMDILQASLELIANDTDVILLGDLNIKEENWERLKYLLKGIVPLRINKNILKNRIFENRKDYSNYVVRNIKRDVILDTIVEIDKNIEKGDILVTDEKGLRYKGDLEIALKNLNKLNDGRRIVASVIDKDKGLLDYLSIINKFIFI